uniref:Uncharacterized protein n=1 Tax=Amphimedon queenslandica TaxID=400682 RepID=A0A1X7U156_AMPQE
MKENLRAELDVLHYRLTFMKWITQMPEKLWLMVICCRKVHVYVYHIVQFVHQSTGLIHLFVTDQNQQLGAVHIMFLVETMSGTLMVIIS